MLSGAATADDQRGTHRHGTLLRQLVIARRFAARSANPSMSIFKPG